jgi:putative oxygen-independent coproporphyrinogen III oxidase
MARSTDDQLGLYISIPFCRSKCTYCNFASGVYPARDHDRYVNRLIEDVRACRRRAQDLSVVLPHTIDTVYLGGGTPSLLAPELISRLFHAIRTEFDLEAGAEVTVECAPGQIADATLHSLAQAGVNRVSLGVQSFIDSEARGSGRLHNRSLVLDDLRRLRSAGITNLNIDLIAGLAGQSLLSWTESLKVLVETGVPHASIYMLEVDDDSRLGRELLAGGARYHAELVPSDDTIARMYETAIDTIESASLRQYEISNFARPGFESRHNLRYWQRRPYLGIGLDASSALPARETAFDISGQVSRRVLRSKTTDNLGEYLDGVPASEDTWFSPARQHEEAWFLGLRLNAGVEVSTLEREFGCEAVARSMEIVRRLDREGLVIWDGSSVRLTPRGRLLSNDVFAEFLQSNPMEIDATLAS